jgi:hypothetical protein
LHLQLWALEEVRVQVQAEALAVVQGRQAVALELAAVLAEVWVLAWEHLLRQALAQWLDKAAFSQHLWIRP